MINKNKLINNLNTLKLSGLEKIPNNQEMYQNQIFVIESLNSVSPKFQVMNLVVSIFWQHANILMIKKFQVLFEYHSLAEVPRRIHVFAFYIASLYDRGNVDFIKIRHWKKIIWGVSTKCCILSIYWHL